LAVTKIGGDRTADVVTIANLLKPEDVVLVLTTGDIGGLIPPLLRALESAA
jgi:UDP-N-acetylmuramate-alanine ligase